PLYDFNERDVWVMFHSFCFDFSVWEMYGALFFGGKLIIPSREIVKNSAAFAELLIEKGVTVLNQTPSAFYVLQEHILRKNSDIAIRFVIFGGESLSLGKMKKWLTRYPDCDVINMYGITETTVFVTYQYLDLALCDCTLSLIGKAIPKYYCHVLDENKNQVRSGVEGELYVGVTGLARGYLNLEQFSAERFIKDPFSSDPEARLYRSGDLVKSLSDGSLEYIGRIDQQVKIRGYRIELGEIENVLQEHPVVNQAVVLARDDNKGGKQLVSYIVSDGGFTKEDLIAHLNTRLPDHMVPRIFLAVDEIPLTINGKVDKSRLPNPNISDLIR